MKKAEDNQPERWHGLSVVIPTYNEEHGIAQVLEGLLLVLTGSNLPFEIIAVDDGSSDQTADVIRRYPVRLLRHHNNCGYGASLKTGIRAAQYDLIGMIDADGEYAPEDFPALLTAMADHDMAVGARAKNPNAPSPFIRKPGKWLLVTVANYLVDMKIPDLNSGLRVFSRELVESFMHILPDGFSFTTTITLASIQDHYRIAWIPVQYTQRTGKSKVNVVKDGSKTLLLILRAVVLFNPLKVFLPASGFFFLAGVVDVILEIIINHDFPDVGVVFITTAFLTFFFGLLADQISAMRRGMKK